MRPSCDLHVTSNSHPENKLLFAAYISAHAALEDKIQHKKDHRQILLWVQKRTAALVEGTGLTEQNDNTQERGN